MSDLIDRQALLKQIDIDSDGEPGYYGDTWKFIDTIKNMPNVHDLPKNTDTISRQAAIETVMECYDNDELFEVYEDKLRELPPANNSEIPNSSDTISRQAAIEALRGYLVGKRCPDDGTLTCRLIENEVINKLPPAQPEIVRCGQCKYAEVADKEDAQDGYTCQFHRGSIWFSGSYCSWAERRTDE